VAARRISWDEANRLAAKNPVIDFTDQELEKLGYKDLGRRGLTLGLANLTVTQEILQELRKIRQLLEKREADAGSTVQERSNAQGPG